MKTIQLQVQDDLLEQALDYVKRFVTKHKNESNYKYIDSIGDTIAVIDNKKFVIPSKEDLEILNQPINKDDYISSDEAKKILLNV
ncbi:MAG: hypothetical protein U9Q20_08860 [Campylobacterota bacterium]|nr:hypothetical protein [Campylobacterota bacterium]